MKKLHRINNNFILEIVKASTCAHSYSLIIDESGDRVCSHCGETIYLALYRGIITDSYFPAA